MAIPPIPTHINNIFNIHIDNISSNGSLNFGNDILKGFKADSKSVGGQTIIGDFSPSGMLNGNVVTDPDGVDQPQTQF
jgi:hypothetical protein